MTTSINFPKNEDQPELLTELPPEVIATLYPRERRNYNICRQINADIKEYGEISVRHSEMGSYDHHQFHGFVFSKMDDGTERGWSIQVRVLYDLPSDDFPRMFIDLEHASIAFRQESGEVLFSGAYCFSVHGKRH